MSKFSRKDNDNSQVKALPAAAATAYTTSIDWKSIGDTPEAELKIVANTLTALVEAKTIIYQFEESTNNSSWADAAWSPLLTQTGVSGNGAAAATLRVRPPSDAKRYIRLQAAVLTGGGDNTAVNFGFDVMV